MTVNTGLVAAAFAEENVRKAAYEAQARDNWNQGEGLALRLKTARHIKVALELGAKKSDILRAIDRKGYKVLDDYLDLLRIQPDHVNAEESVVVVATGDNSRAVHLKNYSIGETTFTGTAAFEQDDDGDWLPTTEGDLTQAVDNELFIDQEERDTPLTRKWGAV